MSYLKPSTNTKNRSSIRVIIPQFLTGMKAASKNVVRLLKLAKLICKNIIKFTHFLNFLRKKKLTLIIVT